MTKIRTLSCFPVFAVYALTLASSRPPAANAQAPHLTRAQVIAGVRQSREALAKLPNLYVSYRLKTDAGGHHFAWPWMELIHAFKPPKMYFYCENPVMWGQEKMVRPGFAYFQEIGYDGRLSFAMKWERADLHAGKTQMVGYVMTQPAERISTFAFYFQNLAHPLTKDMEAGLPVRKRYPPGAYWLPDALVDHSDDYHLLPDREQIDGHLCYVLERPGLDKLWIDPRQGFAVVRRRFHWGQGQPLRDIVTNRRYHQLTADVWLPMEQVKEEFYGPWEIHSLWNKREFRQVASVHKLSVDPLPDTLFTNIDVPAGTEIADYRTNSYFRKLSDDANPFDEAMARAKGGIFGKSSFLYVLVLVSGIAGGVLLAWLLARRLRQRLREEI